MKASELRQGNYIIINNIAWSEYKDIPLMVTGISAKTDLYNYFPKSTGSVNAETIDKHNSFAQFDEFIEPIPLTEGWLLKLGYKKASRDNVYIKHWGDNGIEICVYEYHYKGQFEYEVGEHRYKTIESVHQLQNLYFALTGEELDIQ